MRIAPATLAPLIVAAVAHATASGAQPPPLPRDRPPVLREGTETLTGRIVDGVTGAPIARARVRLSSPGGPRPSVLTDANGNFAFAKLPAGPYVLHAEKSTYLPARYPDAGRTLLSRMQPLIIAEGQPAARVTVPLFRTSAIAGRVLDAYGDPVENTYLQVMKVPASGYGRPQMRGGDSTNDLGEFRIGRLQPGSYLLLATPRSLGRGEPSTSEAPSAQPLPTFYPGVLAMDQALPITVERGQSALNIDLVLVEAAATVVTGTLVHADGRPVTQNAFVSARFARGHVGMDVASTGLRTGGTFRLQLAPGDYVLVARAMERAGGEQTREEERFGTVRLTVGGSALEPVTIVLGRGATASGRIVFEGTTPPPPPPANPAWLPLSSPEGEMCRSRQVHVDADWTFRVEGLVGTCIAPLQLAFGRWTLKSVLVDGEDLLRQTVTFEPGQQLQDVRVVFTDRRTSVRFRVADEAGRPTRQYVALVFSTDKSQWKHPRYTRTYVPPHVTAGGAMAAPGPGGARTSPTPSLPPARPEALSALAPGEYYVVAVDDLDADDARSAQVLERLIPSAVRVVVPEGATPEVSLRRVKFWNAR